MSQGLQHSIITPILSANEPAEPGKCKQIAIASRELEYAWPEGKRDAWHGHNRKSAYFRSGERGGCRL